MDFSLIVAFIAIIGTLLNTYLNKKTNSKIDVASARKLDIEGDEMLFEFKNKVIAELQHQINDLKRELLLVKEQNAIHITEKIRLEVRIEGLVEKNNLLRNRIMLDSKVHEKELMELRSRIEIINRELQQYKKQHE